MTGEWAFRRMDGQMLITRPGPYNWPMNEAGRRALALLLVAAFFMMVIGPLGDELGEDIVPWLVGLVVALLVLPGLVYLAMAYSKRRVDKLGKGLLEGGGLTEEEWTERRDPDDFEGEVD